MNLNYDQFNGDALIFKYNLDEYGNPISIKVDKEEKQVSVHGTIQLEYVPDEYNRVIILNENNTQMTEVFNRDEIMPNTYYIDYNNGVAYLDKSQFGKTKIYNYYKKGIQLIGCSRIYDEHDVTGKHVVLTLQEIIDAGREALRFLLDIGDAKKVIELLESLIAEGNLTITNLENKKNECIQAIDNAISQATQDKNEIVEEIQENIQEALDSVINVAGNKEVIIKSSQWALNGDVYEKEITHDLNSENLHVTAKNSDTKEAVTIGYKILDKTRILLKSDEAIPLSVILSASYYHATQTISDDIAEEVVKARKGEASLDVKITKIDEQLDNKANNNQLFNTNSEIQTLKKTISHLSEVLMLGNNFVGRNSLLQFDFYDKAINGQTDLYGNTIIINNIDDGVTGYIDNSFKIAHDRTTFATVNSNDKLKISDTMTFEICMKTDNMQTQKFILSKAITNAVDYGLTLWGDKTLKLYSDKTNFVNGSGIIIPDDGQYHTYAITLKNVGGRTIIKTYLDGNIKSSNTIDLIQFNKTDNPIYIGKSDINSTRYFDGNIRYISIYDRELTQNEIIHNTVLSLKKPYIVNISNETNEVDGVTTKAYIPSSYSQSYPNKWIIFNHGNNGYASDIEDMPEMWDILNTFLNEGYVVVASDYTNRSCWGNNQSTIDMTNLVNFYKFKFNLEEKPYVFMQSMGGIVTLNSIAKNTLQPKAVFGVFPVCNLKDIYDRGAFTNTIKSAYGITTDSEYSSKTSGFDPMLSDFTKYKNIPFFMTGSYADYSVPTDTNRDEFVKKLRGVGGYVETLDTTGGHGDVSNYRGDLFVDFMNRF